MAKKKTVASASAKQKTDVDPSLSGNESDDSASSKSSKASSKTSSVAEKDAPETEPKKGKQATFCMTSMIDETILFYVGISLYNLRLSRLI